MLNLQIVTIVKNRLKKQARHAQCTGFKPYSNLGNRPAAFGPGKNVKNYHYWQLTILRLRCKVSTG